MSSKWVQHISGVGKKYEIVEDRHIKDDPYQYVIADRINKHQVIVHHVPTSEYQLCSAPTHAIDVTEGCRVEDGRFFNDLSGECEELFLVDRVSNSARLRAEYRIISTEARYCQPHDIVLRVIYEEEL